MEVIVADMSLSQATEALKWDLLRARADLQRCEASHPLYSVKKQKVEALVFAIRFLVDYQS